MKELGSENLLKLSVWRFARFSQSTDCLIPDLHLNSFQGLLKVSSCSSSQFIHCRGKWQVSIGIWRNIQSPQFYLFYFSISRFIWRKKLEHIKGKQGTYQFSCSVMSDSLRPHEPQHTRPPCPSPTPGVHPNPCPLCWWSHPTISCSVVPFSSCPQSFPASGSLQMNKLFAILGTIFVIFL